MRRDVVFGETLPVITFADLPAVYINNVRPARANVYFAFPRLACQQKALAKVNGRIVGRFVLCPYPDRLIASDNNLSGWLGAFCNIKRVEPCVCWCGIKGLQHEIQLLAIICTEVVPFPAMEVKLAPKNTRGLTVNSYPAAAVGAAHIQYLDPHMILPHAGQFDIGFERSGIPVAIKEFTAGGIAGLVNLPFSCCQSFSFDAQC